MNNRLAVALFVVATLFSVSAFSEESNVVSRQLPYLKNINHDVQLKDNGWIKISEENAYLMTPEQYYGNIIDDKSKIAEHSKSHREISKYLNQDENFRIRYVKIQFLNYCKASLDREQVARVQREMDQAQDKLDRHPGKEPTKMIDVVEMVDAYIPRFRCNYRTTLMTSFYSSTGEEIKTEKNIPIAQWVTNNKRKEEMLPGETMTITITAQIKPLIGTCGFRNNDR